MQPPWQPRPGDVIVRRPRQAEIAPVQIHLRRRGVPVRGIASPMIIVYGFVALAVLGSLLLWLPISTTDGDSPDFMTALFTAVSAITVTGLVVVDTPTFWSGFGEGVIAVLLFLGGLGFMTSAAFLLILMGQRIGLQNQLAIRSGLGVSQLGGLPVLVRNIVLTAVLLQAIGAVAMFLRWYVFGTLWNGISAGEALWQAVFHSASAFNNAGFSIFPPDKIEGESVTAFSGDYFILAVLSGLIILGGLGYLVMYELITVRRLSRLSIDAKLILVGTVALLLAGAALVFALEYDRAGTLAERPTGEKIADAAFQSVVARTAGFTVIDWGETQEATKLSTVALMFIGGASASAAGGIKIGTFAVIILAIFGTLKNRVHTQVFGRSIPQHVVRQALVVGAVAIAAVFALTFALAAIEDQPLGDILFEAVSAFGTVGLSTGITGALSDWGRGIIIAAMFMGRFGPLSLALLMQGREEVEPYRFAEERVRIG
ncbi:MAG: hypothetical protein HQ478_13695 [Chloroflexi bacterium]|nr:hypothetical protein [Chloroflexota bacterium]